MHEPFELPVTYKGEEWLFPAYLQQSGYTHRFVVDINGLELFYEPDEERNYRAIIDPENAGNSVNMDLLQAIAEAIEIIVK